MGTPLGNLKAKKNGIQMELTALDILPKLELTNDKIDAILDDKLIEIKSCQKYVIDVSRKTTQTRFGRFRLNKDQHEYLVKNNGYYFFILNESGNAGRWKLVKASEIEFKHVIDWRRIFND